MLEEDQITKQINSIGKKTKKKLSLENSLFKKGV